MSVIMGNGTPRSNSTQTRLRKNIESVTTATSITEERNQMHIFTASQRTNKHEGGEMPFRGASAPRRINIAQKCSRRRINHVTSAPPMPDAVNPKHVCAAKQTAADEGGKGTFHGASAPRRINLQKPIPRKREVGPDVKVSIELQPNNQARIPTPYKNRQISKSHRQELLTDLMVNVDINNLLDKTTEASVYPSCKLAKFFGKECTNTKRPQLKSVVVKVDKSRSIRSRDSYSGHQDHHNHEDRHVRDPYYDKHTGREDLTKDALTNFKITFRR